MVGIEAKEVHPEGHKEIYKFLFKLILVGPEAVGKSSALQRYVDDSCNHDYRATIGVDFKTKTVYSDDGVIKLQLWDTAGQDRFRVISSGYYRGAHGVMLYFDVTNKSSFDSMSQWYADVTFKTFADCPLVLIGTKSDLKDKRVVPREEAEAFASEHAMPYIETSAITGAGVSEAFQTLIEEMMTRELGQDRNKPLSSMGSVLNRKEVNSTLPKREDPFEKLMAKSFKPLPVPKDQRVNKKSKSCTII